MRDYLWEADTVARFVAIMTKSGALMHDGAYYKTLADIEKPGHQSVAWSLVRIPGEARETHAADDHSDR